mgnify:CR=1 FL=1
MCCLFPDPNIQFATSRQDGAAGITLVLLYRDIADLLAGQQANIGAVPVVCKGTSLLLLHLLVNDHGLPLCYHSTVWRTWGAPLWGTPAGPPWWAAASATAAPACRQRTRRLPVSPFASCPASNEDGQAGCPAHPQAQGLLSTARPPDLPCSPSPKGLCLSRHGRMAAWSAGLAVQAWQPGHLS